MPEGKPSQFAVRAGTPAGILHAPKLLSTCSCVLHGLGMSVALRWQENLIKKAGPAKEPATSPWGDNLMLGLVFTFEDDPEHDPVLQEQTAAKRVREAIALAVNFVDGIHFEEITAATNPTPRIAVIFSDVDLIDQFTARLTLALQGTKIRISSVRAIKPRESSREDVAA